MKKLLALTLLAACLTLPGRAQFYQLSTNVWFTNTVAASATLTSLVTNYFDATRYRSIGLVAIWSGSNTNTNTVTVSFQSGPTSTNWDMLPRYSVAMTSYGTNRSTFTTNISVLDIGYLRAFQIVNACTNSLTNFVLYAQVKEFPRN